MGRKTCAGAGLTACRGGGAALRLAALASGPDGVGAVAEDGHIGGLGSAGRTLDRKSTRLNSSHNVISRMPSSA